MIDDESYQSHFHICRKFPVLCTNKCGVRNIPREKLDVHVRDECPATEVQCGYNYLGCEAVFPRSGTESHYKLQTEQHFNLVLRRVNELGAVTMDQSQEIERLMSKDKRQSRWIEGQSRKIEQLSHEKERLMSKDKRQSQQIERLTSKDKEQSQQIERQSQQIERLMSRDKRQSKQIQELMSKNKEQSEKMERLMSTVQDKPPQREQRLLF
ncbi:TNF receptor-associated factor family protein DDB_G0290965-like, partial [Orbicella faveolata]|uniref:TNF receptor-associated factor family protein DDB_G0290965-like n=1 Tax=Orbicella faveolata TaxID=48498 RepID=UPI0009E29BF3